jgi:hypothetical protein
VSPAQSIQELITSGVELTYAEALAITQELINAVPTDDRAVPPFGPPRLDNVHIYPDGSVECLACGSTPAVSEIARLLDELLRRGSTPRVPGGLRYTIARALLEVDAPPFDSVQALSAVLARYEQGERSDIVRELYARAAPAEANPKVVAFERERRHRGPSASELRRHLRQADEALFQHARVEPPALGEKMLLLGGEPCVPLPEAADAMPNSNRFAAPRWLLAAAAAALLAVGVRYPVGGEFTASSRPSGTTSRSSSPSPAPSRVSANPLGRPTTSAASVSTKPAAGALPGATLSAEARLPASVPLAAAAASTAASGAHPALRRPEVEPGPVVPPATAHSNGAPLSSRWASGAAPRSALLSAAADQSRSRRAAPVVRAVSASSGATFSPISGFSGTALFVQSTSSDGRGSFGAADGNGADLRVMTILDDGAKNYHVRPSADGTRVAFDSDRDGERGVYVAYRDGTGARRVSGPGFAALPEWSPDGRMLAYIRPESDRPRVWNLWLHDLSTGRARRLTSFAEGQTGSASWFPDGHHLCYTHDDRVIVNDLDTGSTRDYGSPVSRTAVSTPAVSPDGRHVIFQVARSGAWLLDLHDASMRCVLTDPTAEAFAWSPDGRRVAFHSGRDGQWGIWVMAPV